MERPPWLNSSVHLYNTAAAWGDLLTSHRSFSRRSERMSSVMIVVYLAYLQLCRYMNGCGGNGAVACQDARLRAHPRCH